MEDVNKQTLFPKLRIQKIKHKLEFLNRMILNELDCLEELTEAVLILDS